MYTQKIPILGECIVKMEDILNLMIRLHSVSLIAL